MWAGGHKADIKPYRLLVEREKCAPFVMVSTAVHVSAKRGICTLWTRRWMSAQHISLEKNVAKAGVRLWTVCCQMVASSSKTALWLRAARVREEWLKSNGSDFITKDKCPSNSPDLNPLDYHVWGQRWSLTITCSQSQNNSRVERRTATDLFCLVPEIHW